MVCRPAGAGTGPALRSALGDGQIAVVDETIEMMAGDVGVDVEQPGDLVGGHRLWCLADCDVDATPSRISEAGREVGDLQVERLSVHRLGTHSVGREFACRGRGYSIHYPDRRSTIGR